MAKTKTNKKQSKSNTTKLSPHLAPALLQQSTAYLQSGQPDEALKPAQKALACLTQPGSSVHASIPALELLGDIHIELGDPDRAREFFLQAAELDPDASLPESAGGGADKFLWLAQLCEEGGTEAVKWFEKGCIVLRREISEQEPLAKTEEEQEYVEIKKQKLANALCGAAEVYMTDLSWEEDAETRCEALVTEACLAAPESPEPLQTLASVRISQQKTEEARSALISSLEMWSDLSPEDPDIPDFPTRISLARLLMEVELEDKALDVLDRLVAEDDTSVEAWYLGGWCLYLLAERHKQEDVTKSGKILKNSRTWLLRSLKLYKQLEYEDERLKQHADELVAVMNQSLGPPPEDDAPNNENNDDDDDEDDDWEDDDDDGDDDGNTQGDEVMADT